MGFRGTTAIVVLGALAGALLGLGIFTFVYARGSAYLTDDPAACANCHVMRDQFAGWMKASHRSAAVCNDCHAPVGFAYKYGTKALNGFLHSWAFTTRQFPDNIRITARNAGVTEGACMKCHADVLTGIQSAHTNRDRIECTRCHAGVGHQD